MQEAGATHLAIAAALGCAQSTVRKAIGPSRYPRGAPVRGGQHLSKGYVRVSPTDPRERAYPTARRGKIPRSHLVWNRAHPEDLVEPGDEVHHVNRTPDDDRIENLRKLTPSAHHAEHRAERRERMRKLTQEQAAEIRARFAAGGVSKCQLGRDYGVSASQIRRIIQGRSDRWSIGVSRSISE